MEDPLLGLAKSIYILEKIINLNSLECNRLFRCRKPDFE